MTRHAYRQEGFSLVEVCLALGVAAFCLVVIFALLPVGLNSNQSASQETLACNILSSVVADLQSCPAPETAGEDSQTELYGISVPPNPVSVPEESVFFFNGDGAFSTQKTAGSKFRLIIGYQNNGTNAKAATIAHLKISWPAEAETPVGEVETLVALDRN